MMQELEQGVRELHEQVERLDELLHARGTALDFSDRRADAAHEVAEKNANRIKLLWIAGLFVALLWTPLTAYGAVWTHELVRNHCYPGVMYDVGHRPHSEPWYCGMFPGTGHHS